MGKLIDLVGQKFGALTVIERAPKPEGSKSSSAFWLCQCDCGVKKIISGNVLKMGKARSCGCMTSRLLSESHMKDITGQKFGHLLVLAPASRPEHCSSPGAYFLCRCDCGHEKIIMGKSLREGKTISCGCHLQEVKDLTGEHFGRLTVLKKEHPSEHETKGCRWICQCECGKIISVSTSNLRSGNVKSCGCLISFGEESIQKILEENKYNYQKQYSFSDLVSQKGYLLRFDFAIFDEFQNLQCLIEFQGEQHYKSSGSKFFDSVVLETDELKKEYCKEHNIPLYCIPYWMRKKLSKDIIFNPKYLVNPTHIRGE